MPGTKTTLHRYHSYHMHHGYHRYHMMPPITLLYVICQVPQHATLHRTMPCTTLYIYVEWMQPTTKYTMTHLLQYHRPHAMYHSNVHTSPHNILYLPNDKPYRCYCIQHKLHISLYHVPQTQQGSKPHFGNSPPAPKIWEFSGWKPQSILTNSNIQSCTCSKLTASPTFFFY